MIILVILFVPIVWMISTAFKGIDGFYAIPPEWIPKRPTIAHFLGLLREEYFLRFYANSIIVAFSTVLLSLIIGCLSAYAFSRFKFKGSATIMLFILSVQMFPMVLLLIPIFITFRTMNLLNTYYALILAHTIFSLPFIIWILKAFFDTIPKELEEAAYIDGCGRFRAFAQIVLPLIIPSIVGAAVYAFLVSWNDFVFALTLTARTNMRTLPVGMALMYIGEFRYRWGDMMAASVVTTLPVVILFVFLQRYLVKGLTAGAVKG